MSVVYLVITLSRIVGKSLMEDMSMENVYLQNKHLNLLAMSDPITHLPSTAAGLFPTFSVPGEFASRIRCSSDSHFHLGGVLQRGELPGPCQNPFAFLGAKLVLTPVIIVFHCFLIWKPPTQCSLAFSGYTVTQKCKEKKCKNPQETYIHGA